MRQNKKAIEALEVEEEKEQEKEEEKEKEEEEKVLGKLFQKGVCVHVDVMPSASRHISIHQQRQAVLDRTGGGVVLGSGGGASGNGEGL